MLQNARDLGSDGPGLDLRSRVSWRSFETRPGRPVSIESPNKKSSGCDAGEAKTMFLASEDACDSGDDLFLKPGVTSERRPDGSIILRSMTPLRPFARCVGDWLEHWAGQGPDKSFLAERSGVD